MGSKISEPNCVAIENADKKVLKAKFMQKILTKISINFILRIIKNIRICEEESAKVAIKKAYLQYRRLKRYDVVSFEGEKN